MVGVEIGAWCTPLADDVLRYRTEVKIHNS